MNKSNEQAYLELLRSWERGGAAEVCAKIRDLFTDATVWVQPGLPTTTGPDEAIAIVQTWGAAFASYELEIRHVARVDEPKRGVLKPEQPDRTLRWYPHLLAEEVPEARLRETGGAGQG